MSATKIVDDILLESQGVIDSLQEEDFQKAFEACIFHWSHCVCFKGDDFKEDGDQI